MLDSRYVHLHEALGLGVMWLKKNAKLIPPPPSPIPPGPKQAKHAEMHPGRLAVLKKINSRTLPAHLKTPPPANTQPENPLSPYTEQYSLNHYLQQLSGSIPPAKVMAMSVCASPADVLAKKLLSGQDGQLFDKMLTAIGLRRDEVHLTVWLHEQTLFDTHPSTETVQAAAPRVQAEWQLCGAQALLLMGLFFERDDVKANLPAGQHFFIPHPQRILSDASLKRPTWETLQALQKTLFIN